MQTRTIDETHQFYEAHKDNKLLNAVDAFLIAWGKTDSMRSFDEVLAKVAVKWEIDPKELKEQILSIRM